MPSEPTAASGHRHTASGHRHAAGAHAFDLPALPEAVDIFDTTLRDGSQQEGLSLTVDDKLRVAEQLDHLGVAFIEGGWPGANPKDAEFFARAPAELRLSSATLVAFGSTRRAGVAADVAEQVVAYLAAGRAALGTLPTASQASRVGATHNSIPAGNISNTSRTS